MPSAARLVPEQAPTPNSMDLYFQGLAWLNKGFTRDTIASRERSVFPRTPIAKSRDNFHLKVTDLGAIQLKNIAEPRARKFFDRALDADPDNVDALIGSASADMTPVWPPVGGGSAMGSEEERNRFVSMVEKACHIARQLSDIGIRKSGVVRIDSASGVRDWASNPAENQKQIAKTFAKACDVAEQYGERLAAEGRSAGAECIAGRTWSTCSRRLGGRRP